MTNGISYICSKIPPEEALAQLAEEAAELSQAALKLRRVLGSGNPTPVCEEEAWAHQIEEVADIMAVLRVLDLDPEDHPEIGTIAQFKLSRWADRLRAKEAGDTP